MLPDENYNPKGSSKTYIKNTSNGKIVIGFDTVIVDDNPDFIIKNGNIVIGENCKIDRGVRLLANNGSSLQIGNNTRIGINSVINAGCDVIIGSDCLISGMVYIQASSHKIEDKNLLIRCSGYEHSPIKIGNDVWIGCNSVILKGVTIGNGAVIGCNSVVNCDVKPFEVVAGSPIKHIRFRGKNKI